MGERVKHGFLAIGIFLALLPLLTALVWFYVWLEERFGEETVHQVLGIIAFLAAIFLLGYFWR
jgi:hypothetical protein